MWPFPKKDPLDADFVVVGGARNPLRDIYDFLMRAPWSTGILMVVSAFLAMNCVFGWAYAATGGLVGARPHSFSDAFFFSVQTLGTLGYGAMYPESIVAHVLVTIEVITGVFMLALVTGFTFSKFSNVRARIQFADHAVIGPFNGVPMLMIRVGNERRSRVIDARIRVTFTRTEYTKEGVLLYRLIDLALERSSNANLARSWTVFHPITETSPFYGATPETLAKDEVELAILVLGLDETSSQAIHAQARYDHKQLLWGARHADVLKELPDGRIQVNLAEFNKTTPTAPIEGFPYPRPATGAATAPPALK
jgi:inward rectifier potassium channel